MTREEFMSILPALVKDYQPADDVLRKISDLSLLMIIGPSGSGKTTLINHLGIAYVPSDTTRIRRPEETPGIDYHFRQDYRRLTEDIRNGRFVQVAIGSGGDFYATSASSYPDNGMAVMAVVAEVVPAFRKLGFSRTISAFITPPSFEEWRRRLKTHKLSAEQLNKRLAEGKRSLSFALTDSETPMVLNDDIEEAAKLIKDLIGGHVDAKMQQRAKAAAENLLNKLELINA